MTNNGGADPGRVPRVLEIEPLTFFVRASLAAYYEDFDCLHDAQC